MELYVIDTNIAFDLIFDGRNRHRRAIEFYKHFKNLELTITDVIKQESIQVISKYSANFGEELNYFLDRKDAHSKKWDQLDFSERCKLIDDFIRDIKNRKDKNPYVPFYSNMLFHFKQDLCHMGMVEINEFRITLPGRMEKNFINDTKIMFTTLSTETDIDNYNEKERIVRNAIQQYFIEKQSKDLNILVNLIILLNFRKIEKKNIDSLIFFTCDTTFRENFNKIIKNKAKVIQTINNHFGLNLDSIKFKSMGEVED